MKRLFFLAVTFMVAALFSFSAMAAELKLLGILGNKGEAGTIMVYGVSAPEQPFTANEYNEGYRNVIIENPHCRTLEVRRITDAVDMAHFGAHDGKWSGKRVVKLVVE